MSDNRLRQLLNPFINVTYNIYSFLDFEEKNTKLSKKTPKSTLLAPEKSIAESEVLCEYCKKSFEPNKILKHIGHVKACKSFYGPRYDELKKEQQRKKVEKFRSKLSNEQKLEIGNRKRELYAKNSEYREKQIREDAKRREKKALDQIEQKQKIATRKQYWK